jgi:single-stranded-DNA-specific exonuclease
MKEVTLETNIEVIAKKFLEVSKEKEIQVISHFDTDGITSAALMTKTLKKLDKRFSLKIVKSLTKEFIESLPKNKITLFLDLASGSLNHIKNSQLENVFIVDHHEVTQEIPKNVNIINPELHDKQKISGSGVTYLFCKQMDAEIKEFAKLAALGMIGDCLEKEIDKLNHNILNDSEIKRKRGLLIYPSTRPLNRALEYSSNPYIPEVTGNIKGVLELLREAGLAPQNGKYKSLIELNEEEMEKIITAVMLRKPITKNQEIIGDIFLLKFYNKLEDAREFSAKINACSRLGRSEIALQLCMEISGANKKADSIYTKYRQEIISALKFVEETEKIQGKNFVIINAKNEIKDTMAGTIASILSNSPQYQEGTIITTLAHYEDKIKISSRMVGKNKRNVREILSNITDQIGGEVGGHECAAGCLISQEKEQEFIDLLKKQFELEVVKIR